MSENGHNVHIYAGPLNGTVDGGNIVTENTLHVDIAVTTRTSPEEDATEINRRFALVAGDEWHELVDGELITLEGIVPALLEALAQSQDNVVYALFLNL